MNQNVGLNLNKELTQVMKSIKMPKPRNNKNHFKETCCHSELHKTHENSASKQMFEAIKDFVKKDEHTQKSCCCKNSKKNKIAMYSGITALAIGAIGITALTVHNNNQKKKGYKHKLNNYLGRATKLAKGIM